MGKGGGCIPSKNHPIRIGDDDSTIEPDEHDAVGSIKSRKLKIYVVFYSMYGHVARLAKKIKAGVDSVDGVEAVLFRVAETLSEDVLVNMKAKEKDGEVAEILSAEELVNADGFLFGFPTRYGCMAAQMKAFFDSTGKLWKEQKLSGKPAGFFVSTGTQGGGQETTA